MDMDQHANGIWLPNWGARGKAAWKIQPILALTKFIPMPSGSNSTCWMGAQSPTTLQKEVFRIQQNARMGLPYNSTGPGLTQSLGNGLPGRSLLGEMESITVTSLPGVSTLPGALSSQIAGIWSNQLIAHPLLAVTIQIENLSGSQLGEARITSIGPDGLPTAGVIVIDRDAAGIGWFVDSTPLDSLEFATP